MGVLSPQAVVAGLGLLLEGGAAVARELRAAAPGAAPRALEVLRHLAEGKLMKQVAADLGIATRTVAFHKYRAMKQLGLSSNAALVRYAVRAQIV